MNLIKKLLVLLGIIKKNESPKVKETLYRERIISNIDGIDKELEEYMVYPVHTKDAFAVSDSKDSDNEEYIVSTDTIDFPFVDQELDVHIEPVTTKVEEKENKHIISFPHKKYKGVLSAETIDKYLLILFKKHDVRKENISRLISYFVYQYTNMTIKDICSTYNTTRSRFMTLRNNYSNIIKDKDGNNFIFAIITTANKELNSMLEDELKKES